MKEYNESLSNIRFKLTHKMLNYLYEFNQLKKKYDNFMNLYIEGDNDNLSGDIDDLADKLDYYRDLFVNEFREINKNTIEKYIRLKN